MTDTDNLQTLHTDAHDAQTAAEQAAAQLHQAVAAALRDGLSAIEIAEALGVTRTRVYQLRNKARKVA